MQDQRPQLRRPSFALLVPVIALAVGVVLWGLLQHFPSLRHISFLAFFAIVLASVFAYPINLLSQVMKKGWATFATLMLCVGVLVGIVWVVVPVFVEQIALLAQQVPRAVDRIQIWWLSASRHGTFDLAGANMLVALREWAQGELLEMARRVLPLAITTVSVLGTAVVLLVLAFFLAYDSAAYIDSLCRLFPIEVESSVRAVLWACGRAIRGWVLGTLVSMTTIGILTALGLLAVGVDSWVALGVLAFLGEFIPYLGPVFSALPGILMGLAQSPRVALYAAAVYVTVQQIEGHLVQPLVMKRAAHIQPGLLIVWQLLFTASFGFTGLLIATPLLAALKAAVTVGYIQRILGRDR